MDNLYKTSNLGIAFRNKNISKEFLLAYVIYVLKCTQIKLFIVKSKISKSQKWYIVSKIVLTYSEKKYFGDQEKLLIFEVEGQEFAKVFSSLEYFFQAVKDQNIFSNRTLL